MSIKLRSTAGGEVRSYRYELPPGLFKLCAGLLECCPGGRVAAAIGRAEQAVGDCFAGLPAEAERRAKLVRMVKENLLNRKLYPREVLNMRYDMNITRDELTEEKKRFCLALLREVGLLDK